MRPPTACSGCKFDNIEAYGPPCDKCINGWGNAHSSNLYEAEVQEATSAKIKSDGGPTSYYELPEGATELRHVISGKQMGFARGNVFKAMYRLGEKEGTDVMYDINKSRLFLDDMEEAYKKGLKI